VKVMWPDFGSADGPQAADGLDAAASNGFLPIVAPEEYRRILHGEQQEDRLQQAREAGHAQGLREGLNAGKREARAEFETARALMTTAARAMQESREAILRESESEMVRLALAIAARVIRKEAQDNRDMALGAIQAALRKVQGDTHIAIRVNPSDLANTRAHRDVWREALDGLDNFEILGDRRVDAGGCVIDTVAAQVDGRVESQLEELTQAIRRQFEENDESPELGILPQDGARGGPAESARES